MPLGSIWRTPSSGTAASAVVPVRRGAGSSATDATLPFLERESCCASAACRREPRTAQKGVPVAVLALDRPPGQVVPVMAPSVSFSPDLPLSRLSIVWSTPSNTPEPGACSHGSRDFCPSLRAEGRPSGGSICSFPSRSIPPDGPGGDSIRRSSSRKPPERSGGSQSSTCSSERGIIPPRRVSARRRGGKTCGTRFFSPTGGRGFFGLDRFCLSTMSRRPEALSWRPLRRSRREAPHGPSR